MDGFPLQIYDLVMLAVLAVSIAFGAWKGMAWQLAALASLGAGVGVALQFNGPLAKLINLKSPWDVCVAMAVLYAATSLVIWLVFRMISDVIDRVRLKEFDRQVGAAFGAAKGVLWCAVITFFVVTLSASAREKVLRSKSGYYTALLIHRAAPSLPPKLADLLGGYLEKYRDRDASSESHATRLPDV